MKLNGILGKGSGKLGSSVFAISGGAQIVREHNPKVSNPNTVAQVEQRAKMKLLSQLAADLAPALFYKKKGLVSARNQFIAANMPLCTYDNEEAKVDIKRLILSAGKTPLPGIFVNTDGVEWVVQLQNAPNFPLKGVYYIGIKKVAANEEQERLAIQEIKYASEPQSQNLFPMTVNWPDVDFIFAVGVKDTEDAAKIAYGDYDAQDATGLAQLGVFSGVKDIASVYTTSSGTAVTEG